MTKKLTCITLLASAALLVAQTAGPQTFSNPDEARNALVQAAGGGLDALKALFGPGSPEILRSGDEVQDQNRLKQFQQAATQKTQLEQDEMNADHMTVLIGNDQWPFGVPLMRKNGRWYFDAKEGKAEISRRIIGGNELDAIEVCRGYVEAQQDYAETDWDGNGSAEYASRIVSTDGKKDGLYWPGEDSPVAAGFAKAAAQGYSGRGAGSKAYHGYFYKILMSQGAAARGGAQDYMIHGRMIGGFGLVAWPAEYGVSGIMTFIVNQDGVVYEKDLGSPTAALVRTMTQFNPDKSWRISSD